MKPMVLVNGLPLVQHAIRHAVNDWRVNKLIVVAAPDNLDYLRPAVGEVYHIDWAIQAKPRGVIDAITIALEHVKTEMTLILCADNTFDMGRTTVHELDMHVKKKTSCLGTRKLPLDEARRFTRIETRGMGLDVLPASCEIASSECWIGPLLLETKQIYRALETLPNDVAQLIMVATHNGNDLERLEMRCADYGIPSELPPGQYRRRK